MRDGGWTGDLLAADMENCEQISDAHVRRFESPEVVAKDLGCPHFCNDGSLKQSGTSSHRFLRNHNDLATCGAIRDELPDGEGDYWSMACDFICRHHVSAPQTVDLFLNRSLLPFRCSTESAEESTTNDYWTADGATALAEAWVG